MIGFDTVWRFFDETLAREDPSAGSPLTFRTATWQVVLEPEQTASGGFQDTGAKIRLD
jgi:hypothetical protein